MNDQDRLGWWSYIYSEGDDVGYFFIEFAAGKGHLKRHVFEQTEDDRAILLPATHSVYTQEELWHSNKSCVHTNTETIELKKSDRM